MPVVGSYLVKVGALPARKVVVIGSYEVWYGIRGFPAALYLFLGGAVLVGFGWIWQGKGP